MGNEEIVIVGCILYIIGIGICAYKMSAKKRFNCFGNNKGMPTGILNSEYTEV
jgi:hypothetical protein